MSTSTLAPIPCGIREILVENFRGIESLKLSFLDARGGLSDVFVLGGSNGGGKTAVLEACLLALGYPELVRGSPLSGGEPGFRITAQVQTAASQYEVTVDGHDGAERSRRKGRDSRELPCLYFSSWRTPKLVGPVSISAGRGKRPAESEENRLWLVKQYLVNAKAHSAMSGSRPGDVASPFESALRQLNEMWLVFHPARDQSFSVEPGGEEPDSGFDVVLVERNGASIPLDSLGSGQLELFDFFGTFLRSKFHEGLLLIDEPELHLDPQWHALLLRAIHNFLPRVQILVATHSPAVFDSVHSFQRRLLLPPGDPRTIAWEERPSEVAG